MKNFIFKIFTVCLLATKLQAYAIDFFNSLVLAPAAGSNTITRTPVLIGMVNDINRKPIRNRFVTIYVDNRKVAMVQTDQNGVWSYKINNNQALSNGIHVVQVSVPLSIMAISWIRGTLFYVQADRAPETYRSGNVDPNNSAINFPAEGNYVNTTTPIVVGSLLNSSFNPVSGETVNVKIDGSTVGNATSNSNGVFSYALTSALGEASHTVGAHCVETSVNLTTNNFVVDVTAPAAPTINAPSQGSTVTSNPVVVSGTTEALATITTFMDGSEYGDVCYANASGNWSIEYELSNGNHSVTAQAADLANNTGPMSSTRNFSVNV